MGTPELFVYGTLTLNAVVFTLLDRIPESVPTEAAGWRVACLRALPYPGLVRDAGSTAAGRVYADLRPAEWSVLDAFEDPTYVIEPLQLENGRRGLAYVWPGDALPETWTPELLDHAALAAYLERCASWRTRHEARLAADT